MEEETEHEMKVRSQGRSSLFNRSSPVTERLAHNFMVMRALQVTAESSLDGDGYQKTGPSDFFREVCVTLSSQESDCTESCDGKFRTFSGCCNNLLNPQYGRTSSSDRDTLPLCSGKTNIPLLRNLPAEYEAGSLPRGGLTSSRLPNPRTVRGVDLELKEKQVSTIHIHLLKSIACIHWSSSSTIVHQGLESTQGSPVSLVLMHFGQFLDHDLTLTPEQDRECCEQAVLQEDLKYPEELRYCFNIDVTDDSFYRGKRDCLPFTRSDPICTEDDSREQINALSAFIDGGAVYGSDLDTATRLRTLEDGLMKTHRLGPSLPTTRMTGLEEEMEGDRLVGGDVRATVQPGLTSMHTLFLNEHNRIAENLGAVNSSLDDEELYQRSRMIVIAELQNIVYDEFLPSVIGPDLMKTLDLELPADNEDSLYDIFTNPGITNEFASVAFRFGHSLIPNFLKISKSPELRTDSVNCPIKDNFFISEDFVIGSDLSGKAWQNLLLGSSGAQTRPFDPLFSETITNFLFCGDNCRLASGFGQDLVARNIQRGRDHGLPGYTKYREFCQLSVPSDWSERPAEISQQTWDRMESVYQNVEDIDPFTGGAAEQPVSGGVVGPTFACLISKQFANIKEGDRLFFTHQEDGLPAGLSSMIKRRTLADIICDNIPIEELPLNTLKISAEKLKCSENNKLNLTTVNICLGYSEACPGNEKHKKNLSRRESHQIYYFS